MAELPTFEQLLDAQRRARGKGAVPAAVQGVFEGIDLKGKLAEQRRLEEELVLQKEKQATDLELRRKDLAQKIREATAGTVQPGEQVGSELTREVTPEVFKALKVAPVKTDPVNLEFIKTNDEIISLNKSTGQVVQRVPITPPATKEGKASEQLFLAANAADNIAQIENILGITAQVKAGKKATIPGEKRALLLPGAQRGFVPGVDADQAAEVDKRLFNATVQVVKLYQGSRPSDFDYKSYLEFIRPKALSFASGSGEAIILGELKDGLKVMVAINKGFEINPNDPAYEKYVRMAALLQSKGKSKTVDPGLENIQAKLNPSAPFIPDSIIKEALKSPVKGTASTTIEKKTVSTADDFLNKYNK